MDRLDCLMSLIDRRLPERQMFQLHDVTEKGPKKENLHWSNNKNAHCAFRIRPDQIRIARLQKSKLNYDNEISEIWERAN